MLQGNADIILEALGDSTRCKYNDMIRAVFVDTHCGAGG